jgi:plasmid stabilization system protein ParE
VNVVITEPAFSDLEKIALYIAKDSPLRAETFVDELVKAALELADRPLAYQLVPRYEDLGIRRRPYGNYLIFYTVRLDRIVVQRILNGAQDYEAILFPKD